MGIGGRRLGRRRSLAKRVWMLVTAWAGGESAEEGDPEQVRSKLGAPGHGPAAAGTAPAPRSLICCRTSISLCGHSSASSAACRCIHTHSQRCGPCGQPLSGGGRRAASRTSRHSLVPSRHNTFPPCRPAWLECGCTRCNRRVDMKEVSCAGRGAQRARKNGQGGGGAAAPHRRRCRLGLGSNGQAGLGKGVSRGTRAGVGGWGGDPGEEGGHVPLRASEGGAG